METDQTTTDQSEELAEVSSNINEFSARLHAFLDRHPDVISPSQKGRNDDLAKFTDLTRNSWSKYLSGKGPFQRILELEENLNLLFEALNVREKAEMFAWLLHGSDIVDDPNHTCRLSHADRSRLDMSVREATTYAGLRFEQFSDAQLNLLYEKLLGEIKEGFDTDDPTFKAFILQNIALVASTDS